MFRHLRNAILILNFMAFSSSQLAGQENSGWRISPEKINIQIGEDRPLQLLNDSAQELHGAVWSVDDPERAEIQEEDGRVVVHAKWVGTVLVSATLGGETRSSVIKIWPTLRRLPEGTTNWGIHPIGREIGDIPAVPTGDGPDLFSLEQTAGGSTYLRADKNDGIQIWTWLMPENTRDVELVCGDWFGGALISASQTNSYTLYAVGKDGKLRWRHTEPGLRKGLAISTEHLVHLLSQSPDGTVTSITGLDELSGEKKFELPLPASRETQINVRKDGTQFACTSSSVSSPSRTIISHLYVSMDGLGYVAFTQNERTLGTAKCTHGSTVDPGAMYFRWVNNLVLWQIHPDGTYRSTAVETISGDQPFSTRVDTVSPTGSLVTDNLHGMLIPVQLSHHMDSKSPGETDEYVYHVDPEGKFIYKLSLPKYTGALHDEMVGGEDVFFATRGGTLIAFNMHTGEIVWRWNSNTPEISVFAALANGDCLVQTPTSLVEVEVNGLNAKEVVKGKAMMDWQGHMFIKHN